MEDKIKYYEVIEKYKDFFKKTEREYIHIESTSELTQSSLTSSKLFGKPYVPLNSKDKHPQYKNYPTDDNGVYLQMLAQINLSDLPDFKQLPSKGILQFWMLPDQNYGDNYEVNKVIYHPEIDINEDNLITDFSFLPIPDDGCLPLDDPFCRYKVSEIEIDNMRNKFYRDVMNIGYPLSFEKKKEFVNLDNMLSKLRGINDEACDYIWDNLFYNEYYDSESKGAKIGGYAYSTQCYVSECIDPEKDFLLFQIDSNIEAPIMFGDVGVANFFIENKHLKKLKFEESWFNWDCT